MPGALRRTRVSLLNEQCAIGRSALAPVRRWRVASSPMARGRRFRRQRPRRIASQPAAYLYDVLERPGILPCCSGSAAAAVQRPEVGHMPTPNLFGPPARCPAVEARHSLFGQLSIRRIRRPALHPDRRVGQQLRQHALLTQAPRASRPPRSAIRSSASCSSPRRSRATFPAAQPSYQNRHGDAVDDSCLLHTQIRTAPLYQITKEH